MSEHLFPAGIERALIGSLLLTRDIGSVDRIITATDFSKPQHQATYAAMREAWLAGAEVEPVLISEARGGLGVEELVELLSQPHSASNVTRYAKTIANASRLRSIVVDLDNIQSRLQRDDEPVDASEILADLAYSATARLSGSDESLESKTLGQMRAESEAEPERHEWLWPNFIRRRWRIVIAGGEGIGKMVLLRQIALCLAAGHDPFFGKPLPPIRSLVVDLENPEPTILEQSSIVSNTIDLEAEAEDRYRTFSREQGMNLLEAADRRRFETVVAGAKPDLLVVGPLYKMKRPSGRGYDSDAIELINYLDDVRTRHNCALLMEHHLVVEKNNRALTRSPDQADSAFFLRWPEMSFSMVEHPEAHDGERIKLVRARRGRNAGMWPPELLRREPGAYVTGFAWRAKYDDLRPFADDAPPAPDDEAGWSG